MGKNTRFVGLDVHAETIAVAVAEGRYRVRSLGKIANRPEAVRRLLGKLGKLPYLANSRCSSIRFSIDNVRTDGPAGFGTALPESKITLKSPRSTSAMIGPSAP